MTEAVTPEPKTFGETIAAFRQPKMAMMLVLGFTAGLPFLLYFSTLSVWLKEGGTQETLIGFFSFFGLAYAFKFMWAPLIDNFKVPGFHRLFGHRRSWVFVAQMGLVLAFIGIGFTNPTKSLAATALFSFFIAFFSATQDISIDAWRIEAAKNDDEQAPLAAAYQYGYKVGMVISGGVALMIAGISNFPIAYWSMAAVMALAAIIFAVWDRKGGIEAAASTGAMLLSVGLATMFGQFANVAKEGIAFRVLDVVKLGFYALAAAAFIAVLWFFVKAIRDSNSEIEFSASNLLKGSIFTIAILVAAVAIAAGIGLAGRTLFNALGWEPTRSQIRNIAGWLAATPIIVCAIAVPFIRRLPANSEKLSNPGIGPFIDFFWRHGWAAVLILLFVSTYRLSDFVMGVMAKPAYTDTGYTALDIGLVSGTYGVWVVFIGVALAGISALKLGLRTSLVIGAIVSVLGNVVFAWLVNQSSESLTPLFIAVTADNIAGGYAGTVFVAYLSTLVAKSFAGTQYAIFSSIYALGPKLLAGTSGTFVDDFGYTNFFLYAAALGIPAIFLSMLTSFMKPDRENNYQAEASTVPSTS